jgi:hypothetical protein
VKCALARLALLSALLGVGCAGKIAPQVTPRAPLSACIATTNVPEFEDGVSRTCGAGIKSVSIEGDHDRVMYTITYLADLTGRQVDKPMRSGAVNAARTSWEILSSIYPMQSFSYRFRDRQGHAVCDTEIRENGEGATVCVATVGDETLPEPRPAAPKSEPANPGPAPEGTKT